MPLKQELPFLSRSRKSRFPREDFHAKPRNRFGFAQMQSQRVAAVFPRRWRRRGFYFFSPQKREAKFEIHYLIKLKEMSAESNVMEGLKGSALGERNDNSTSR